MTLADLPNGSSGRIVRVTGQDVVSVRVLEMGVTPGAIVKRIGQAPLGDPLEFDVRGYRLSLRKSEAERVEIESLS